MNAKELTVLMVKPGKHPKVTALKNDLGSKTCKDGFWRPCQRTGNYSTVTGKIHKKTR